MINSNQPIKIDAHQHFWNFKPNVHVWIDGSMSKIQKDFLPSELIPLLERNGFDGSIAVQVEQNEADTDFLLNLASKYDFIKGVVGWVDLNAVNVKERLSYYSKDPKFKGVRHTVYDEKGEFLLNPSFQNGIKQLQAQQLSFDLLVFGSQLSSAVELVRKFPDQAFVLNHLAKPDISKGPTKEWKEQMRQLGACGNAHAKLSGMFTETENFQWEKEDFYPFLDVMLEVFGTQRLMFGSDWPVSSCAATYQEVYQVVREYFNDYGSEDVSAIFGGNACRFYKL